MHRRTTLIGAIFALLLALTVAACGTAEPTATPTSGPGATSEPTATAAPTATSAPTAPATQGPTSAPPSPTAAPRSTTAPTPTVSPTPAGFPLTIANTSGDQVTFTEPPQRIVSFSPAETEIFFALGVGDRVVGRDRFSDYPPAAQEVQAVGDAFNVDLEKIAALEPDMAYVSFESPKAKIESLDVPVVYLQPASDLEGVLDNILLMGWLTGRTAQARQVVEEIEAELAEVEERLEAVEQGPRVYYELDPGLFTVGPNTFIGDLLTRLKARNIAAEADGPYPQLSNEFIVAQDPEVILLGDSKAFGNGDETPETIAARPGWGDTAAVREGRVYPVNPNLVSRPGPRIAQGLRHLAETIYPELFR